jgi:MoaA/NifB/PqqE/SkfB family radical SAM enzyme
MKGCKRVGMDSTKRCNWYCTTCFYRHEADFNDPYDKPWEDMKGEIDRAKARGCDHALLVGWGETSLYKHLFTFLEYCNTIDIKTSIITHGASPVKHYQKMYDAGINHIHVSAHHVNQNLDLISEQKGSIEKQTQTLEYLRDNKLPFRTNSTIQKLNYKDLPQIARKLATYNPYHIVLLGFLPHYDWGKDGRVGNVAVHPAELRPYIEEALDVIIDEGIYATLRYHPLCHLDKKYWKYVTNARYVLYDPWEWEYEKYTTDEIKLWEHACQLGDSVSVKGHPCGDCAAKVHCGGYNRRLTEVFPDNAGLKKINLAPDELNPGYFFDQNPANSLSGHIPANTTRPVQLVPAIS